MQRLIASWFGTGLILGKARGADSGSGTVGALAAAVAAYSLYGTVDWPWQVAATAMIIAVGMWAVRGLVSDVGDAGWIVVDEAAGVFLALIGLEHWEAALAAYLVFRIADIYKRWFPGVSAAERLRGATGVMADDLVAGLYGLIAGHIVQTLV